MDDVWTVFVVIAWGMVIGGAILSKTLKQVGKKNAQDDSLLLIVAQALITDKAFSYIARGYIMEDEYQNLRTMFHKYQARGGNGMAERMMMEVDKLTVKNSRYAKTAGEIVMRDAAERQESEQTGIMDEIAEMMPKMMPKMFPVLEQMIRDNEDKTSEKQKTTNEITEQKTRAVCDTEQRAAEQARGTECDKKKADRMKNEASDGTEVGKADEKHDDEAQAKARFLYWMMQQMMRERQGK